ncbi:MAG: DNRLRE domain-containing protein, partial [Saprospiraceae bacterium]|nr:DNRLRE domain-containing protein [Saprospiraceae bacterium]
MKPQASFTLLFFGIFLLIGCQKDPVVNSVPLAYAGSSRTIELPKDTIVLRGSGEDFDGQIAGYLWSKVSGPNTPVIHNNGSPLAFIDGFIPGVYLYQLMVVDNLGATGIDTVKFTLLVSEPVNLSLQPAQNPNEIHIFGNSFNNEGSSQPDEIGAAYWTSQGTEVGMRGAMKFDLTNIPSNASIISAKLSLYSHPDPVNGDQVGPNSGTNNSMLIQRITSPWVANTVRWVNQPTSTNSLQVVIPATAQSSLDLVNINVKDLVSSMIVSNNYGFLIRLQNEVVYNSRIFCSSR